MVLPHLNLTRDRLAGVLAAMGGGIDGQKELK